MNLNSSEAFFYEHAGYGYDPKTETPDQGRERCAKQLAMYESLAVEQGLTFVWREDSDGCGGCECEDKDRDRQVLACLMMSADGREILDSLWSICEPSAEYKRVVEAEIAGDRLSRGLWASAV